MSMPMTRLCMRLTICHVYICPATMACHEAIFLIFTAEPTPI